MLRKKKGIGRALQQCLSCTRINLEDEGLTVFLETT